MLETKIDFDPGRANTVIIAPKDCAKRIGGTVRTLMPEEVTIDNTSIKAVEAYNLKRFKSSGKLWHPKGYGWAT